MIDEIDSSLAQSPPDLRSRRLVEAMYGTVENWRADCRLNPDPTRRNEFVLDEIFRRHPEFRQEVANL